MDVMMSDVARQEPAQRRPHAPPMAGLFLEFDLTAEVNQLRRETTVEYGPERPDTREVPGSPGRPDGHAGEHAHSRTQDRGAVLGPTCCRAMSASVHPGARSTCVPAVSSLSIREALPTSKHWRKVRSC
jgi:hypothetical protein